MPGRDRSNWQELDKELTHLANVLGTTAVQITEMIDDTNEGIEKKIEASAKERSPFVSGDLMRSIYGERYELPGEDDLLVFGATVPYAHRVHELPRTRTGEPKFLINAIYEFMPELIGQLDMVLEYAAGQIKFRVRYK